MTIFHKKQQQQKKDWKERKQKKVQNALQFRPKYTIKVGENNNNRTIWLLWSTLKCMQVQLQAATRADRLPFVYARNCKSSLNSSITSRSSQRGNQKHWNNPRSLYMSNGFIQSQNLQSLWVGLCTCTKPAIMNLVSNSSSLYLVAS